MPEIPPGNPAHGLPRSQIISSLTHEQALAQNPSSIAPEEIISQQELLDVVHFNYDARTYVGQIVVNRFVADDVLAFFTEARRQRFPIFSVIPAAHPRFKWDADKLMVENITSGFNYRPAAGSTMMSLHALGRAFDVNPVSNPYRRRQPDGTMVSLPPGAIYDPERPGTLFEGHDLVQFMLEREWVWGGHWALPDYQHFELAPNADEEAA